MRRVAILPAQEAVKTIGDGATIATTGFVGCGHPEELVLALEQRFLSEEHPRNLTLVHAAGQGDGKNRGLNHLAYPGLVKCVIGGHWNLIPKLGRLAAENAIEAYNLPQGVISQLFREIAAHHPGVITHVGLGSFADPRNGGGKLNRASQQDLVEVICLAGHEWLLYKSFPIDVALVRGTASDSYGNISLDEEALIGEGLSIAQAAKNSGGKVIAQVGRIVEDFSRDPKSIRIPGIFVDAVVVAHPEHHPQTFSEPYNPAYVTQGQITSIDLPRLPAGPRRCVARRAFMEIAEGDIVNLGIGMPEGVAQIAKEMGRLDRMVLTVEAGPIGGVPAGGLSFGASVYPMAIIDQPYMFDFYNGGGLNIACLGMGECDEPGNVNVSKLSGRVTGVGGFLNIAQTTRRIVFMGTFTAGGLETSFEHGRLRIVREGKARKFVRKVEHLTFSAAQALRDGKTVLYVTERAVFRLTGEGLELIEIAPGIDLEANVLAQMDFRPLVAPGVKSMDPEIFQ